MGKFLDISTLVFADLSGHEPLTNLLSNGAQSIYPLIAEADEKEVFITYEVQYDTLPNKDSLFLFTVIVRSWAQSYNDTLAIADQVTSAVTISNNVYREISGKPVFNEQDEFYLEQIFNIKK